MAVSEPRLPHLPGSSRRGLSESVQIKLSAHGPAWRFGSLPSVALHGMGNRSPEGLDILAWPLPLLPLDGVPAAHLNSSMTQRRWVFLPCLARATSPSHLKHRTALPHHKGACQGTVAGIHLSSLLSVRSWLFPVTHLGFSFYFSFTMSDPPSSHPNPIAKSSKHNSSQFPC